MDKQHAGLCFPLPITGILSLFACLEMFSFVIIAFLLCMQFIREYTSKVDDLVKDRIESQKEEKAKEQEEKDVVAQQVI